MWAEAVSGKKKSQIQLKNIRIRADWALRLVFTSESKSESESESEPESESESESESGLESSIVIGLFFRFWFRLRQSGFHMIVSDGLVTE